MTTHTDLLRKALDALESRCGTNADERQPGGLIPTLRAALDAPAAQAQPAPVPVPAEPFLFVAMDDDKKAHLTWCADEAEVHEAVKGAMFFSHDGEELDAEHTEQLTANVAELLDSGALTFEGDAPLFLYRVSAAAPAAPVVQQPGWQWVPVEPTEAMLDSAARASMQHMLDCINDPKRAKEVGSEAMVRKTHASRYRSMLAAAPQAPTGRTVRRLTPEQIDALLDRLDEIGRECSGYEYGLPRHDEWLGKLRAAVRDGIPGTDGA